MNDYYAMHAREHAELPAGWTVAKWEANGLPTTHISVTGAVYATVTRGKRKGRPNWRKHTPGTRLTVTFSVEAHERWLRKWERDTGKCHRCDGHGEMYAGWSRDTGTRMSPCTRCDATGTAPVQEPR